MHLRVGIIGAGMAGQAHAFGYRNAMMGTAPGITVELSAIADPNLALAEQVAARYGFATAIADVDQLVASDVDILSVALPNFLHAEVLPHALASGKHVFAEKPIGRTLEESLALEALAAQTSGVTGVGFSFRRLPALAALRDAVTAGRIGDLHTLRAWYYADYAADERAALSWRYSQERSGGGALLDIGAHAIDAVHFVAGEIASVLSSTLRTRIPQRPLPNAGTVGHGASTSSQLGEVTNDDVALLTVELASGAIGHIELSRITHGIPNSLGIEAFGTRGHAHFDSLSSSEFDLFETGPDTSFNGPKRIVAGPQHPYFADVAAMPGAGVGTGYAEAFVAEIQEFLRCISDRRAMQTGFHTSTSMMRVVDAALKATKSGRPVAIDTTQAVRISN